MEVSIPLQFPDLRVEERAGRGRCLVAARAIPAGRAVLISAANCAFPASDAICHACWRPARGTALLRCTTCKTSYCSAACQKADWKPFHQLECRLLLAFKHKESKVPPPVWVPLLLAARLYRGQGAAAVLPAPALAAATATAETTSGTAATAASASAPAFYATLADLQSLSVLAPASNPASPAYARAQAIVALARQLNLFPPVSVLSDARAIRDQLVFDSNNFTLTDETFDVTGFGAYPAAALMNHSCTPNVVLSYGFTAGAADGQAAATTQIVRTLLPLKEGDELVHPYCDVTKSAAERRAELYSQYAFDCDCAACSVEMRGVEEEKNKAGTATETETEENAHVARALLMISRAR